MIFASAFKVYSTISGRRFNSDLRDAHEKGYLSKMPSYNSMFDYFGYPMVTPYLKQLVIESSRPLSEVDWDFAADSSGFSTGVYQRWSDAKWGKARMEHGDKLPDTVNRKDWVKVHLMCGVKTNIVTAAEVSHAHRSETISRGLTAVVPSHMECRNQPAAQLAYCYFFYSDMSARTLDVGFLRKLNAAFGSLSGSLSSGGLLFTSSDGTLVLANNLSGLLQRAAHQVRLLLHGFKLLLHRVALSGHEDDGLPHLPQLIPIYSCYYKSQEGGNRRKDNRRLKKLVGMGLLILGFFLLEWGILLFYAKRLLCLLVLSSGGVLTFGGATLMLSEHEAEQGEGER